MHDEYHIPVLLDEIIDYLKVKQGGLYIDCTLGGGGHSLGILKAGGTVFGIDRDPEAIEYAVNRLKEFDERFTAFHERFSGIADVAGDRKGIVDGVLMDLGVSSRMIDDPERGFSYRHEGPLLMTMEKTGEAAFDVLNRLDARELATIFRDYGEERHAMRIARLIVEKRTQKSIETTSELADIVEDAVGPRLPQKSKARVFQALRIYVNDEITELREGLENACDVLGPGGRLCVISYHSIEDRIVKRFLREKADPCICPKDFPHCSCGRTASVKLISRKALRASKEETEGNPRARSALLRVAEKLPNESVEDK